MNDYIFIKKINDFSIYVAKEDWFEWSPLCEAYNEYGQPIGCYEAKCHTWGNGFFEEELIGKLGYDPQSMFVVASNTEDFIKGFKHYFNIDLDIKKVENIVESLEAHTEAYYYTYWDGKNFKSIILDDEYYGKDYKDYIIIEDKEKIRLYTKIYEEAIEKGIDYIEKIDKQIEIEVNGETYEVYNSRMSTFWPLAIIE